MKTFNGITRIAAALCAALAASEVGVAQSPEVGVAGTVSVSGAAELTKAPDQLRLQLRLFAKGSDISSARTQLRAVETEAVAKLVELGAEKESVVIGEPAVSSFKLPFQQQLQQRLDQRRMELGRNPAPKSKPFPELPVILEVYMLTQWKLAPDKEPQLFAHQIHEATRKQALQLTGVGDLFKVSQEEQELGELLGINTNREEFATPDVSTLMRGGYPFNQSMIDVRLFQVAKVTKPERLVLFKEAFRKAKSDATDLAQAAESSLGGLISLNNSSGQQNQAFGPGYYNYGPMAQPPQVWTDTDTEFEVVRPVQPANNDGPQNRQEPLKYRVTVNAVFRLQTH